MWWGWMTSVRDDARGSPTWEEAAVQPGKGAVPRAPLCHWGTENCAQLLLLFPPGWAVTVWGAAVTLQRGATC